MSSASKLVECFHFRDQTLNRELHLCFAVEFLPTHILQIFSPFSFAETKAAIYTCVHEEWPRGLKP